MTDEAPAGRPHSAPSYTPFFIAILTPFAVAIAAAALPDLTAHPLARAALALVAAAPPVALLVSLVLRARLIEESVRQLARGDFARALPSVDGAHLSGILLDLDGMRRTLHGQLRDLGLSSEEQDRNLGLARRSLQELTVGVARQLTAVEETATSLHEMTASLKDIAEHVEVLASSARGVELVDPRDDGDELGGRRQPRRARDQRARDGQLDRGDGLLDQGGREERRRALAHRRGDRAPR